MAQTMTTCDPFEEDQTETYYYHHNHSYRVGHARALLPCVERDAVGVVVVARARRERRLLLRVNQMQSDEWLYYLSSRCCDYACAISSYVAAGYEDKTSRQSKGDAGT